MKKIVSILRLDFLPEHIDCGLLLLRIWLGASMLILHGWQKLSTFHSLAKNFPDPLGVGSRASLSLAVTGEVLCSILLILGVFARTAALGLAVTMGVAFFLVNEAALKRGPSSELAFIYLAGYLTLLIAGPGRFALDRSGKGGRSTGAKPRPSRE